jgi:hypothetical protein
LITFEIHPKEIQMEQSIRDDLADSKHPNPGRIYDYVLGGHHNFEVDRRVAKQLVQLAPFVPKFARLQRWCLRQLAIELTNDRGFDAIVDFASGLPTADHIHKRVKPGTVVIYSDWDPLTVECGQDILEEEESQDVYYFEADARYPERLLNNPEIERILDGRRDVALIYWGVGGFLSDEDIAHAARELYEWSGPKACLAFNAQGAGANEQDPARMRIQEIYDRMGTKTFVRSLEHYEQLLVPWRPDSRGFVSLLKWHKFDETLMTEEDIQSWGDSGGGYGVYLIK